MKLLLVNLALWTVAILLHPITRLLPTGSGTPPKIMEFLIPVFTLMLAGASTCLLKSALDKSKPE